jgi:hypothetical protein
LIYQAPFFAILNHMAYRSWLKDVKHVGDLGQQLVPLDWKKPDIEERERLADERWSALYKKTLPVSLEHSRYFGCGLHDSWVVGHERTESEFVLKMDSDHAHEFMIHLGLYVDLDVPLFTFPVDLRCHDVAYLRWARPDPRGVMRYSRPNRRRLEDTKSTSDTLIHDWFFEQDGRLQWIVHFWAHLNEPGLLDSSCLFLMVDCASVSAEDGCRNAITTNYGPKAGLLWKEFWSQTDFLFCDQPQLFALIETISKREGWTKNDLRQELLQVPAASILEAYRANVEAENLVK